MSEEKTKETREGVFTKDLSGLWHYKNTEFWQRASDAALDAIKHCPDNAAAWFWYNGSPCPILQTDNPTDLTNRWLQWNTAWTTDPGTLRNLMTRMTG